MTKPIPKPTRSNEWCLVANEYFKAVVVNHKEDACLFWPLGLTAYGYGMFTLKPAGRRVYAHREACRSRLGPPPSPKHEAAHTCQNGGKGCVSPMHVRWATHGDNMRDKVAQGTVNRGSRNGRAKLGIDDVRRIRAQSISLSQTRLASLNGVSATTIGSIVKGETWGWVE